MFEGNRKNHAGLKSQMGCLLDVLWTVRQKTDGGKEVGTPPPGGGGGECQQASVTRSNMTSLNHTKTC